MPHRVVALIANEVVAFDLAIPAQVFGREPERYAWAVCAPVPGPVPTETGFDVVVPHGLEALADADTVVVPGIGDRAWPLPARALDALRAAAARGARVASICTGAFVLAAAGLLDGRRATTHWRYAARLAREFPRVDVDPDVLYVDEGDVLTSAGVAAGVDLCLHIVRRDFGAEAANAIARRMVVAAHRDGGQAQYVERPLPAGGGGLAATRAWMDERLAEPLTVEEMAAPRRLQPALLRPPLPGRDRHDAAAVADRPAGGGGAAAARGHRLRGRGGGGALRVRWRGRAAAALRAGGGDVADGVSADVPGGGGERRALRKGSEWGRASAEAPCSARRFAR